MKRWLTLTLAGLLALSLAGCGSSGRRRLLCTSENQLQLL